uniref:Prostaglandin E2 receptor EP4 subtype n=1 Tax=Eptatretus burgeri TaxID=7764 RepID=A0A8C4QD06_EPTBU
MHSPILFKLGTQIRNDGLHMCVMLFRDQIQDGNRSINGSANRVDISKVAIPATMFIIGVLGNGIAILVLSFSHKHKKESTFYTLVCGLAVTDLLGTCLTSPVVICTYLAGYQWPGGQPLCEYFSFMLLFFGAAGMCILCAMAIERYVAINHAYFYRDNVDKDKALVTLLVIYVFNVLFCALPSMGVGRNVIQDPPTWCYLDWRTAEPLHATYVYTYACFVAALVLLTVACNVRVCSALVAMMRRTNRPRNNRRRFHMSNMSGEEIQMLCLLVIITLIFLVCSLPLVVKENILNLEFVTVHKLHGNLKIGINHNCCTFTFKCIFMNTKRKTCVC